MSWFVLQLTCRWRYEISRRLREAKIRLAERNSGLYFDAFDLFTTYSNGPPGWKIGIWERGVYYGSKSREPSEGGKNFHLRHAIRGEKEAVVCILQKAGKLSWLLHKELRARSCISEAALCQIRLHVTAKQMHYVYRGDTRLERNYGDGVDEEMRGKCCNDCLVEIIRSLALRFGPSWWENALQSRCWHFG